MVTSLEKSNVVENIDLVSFLQRQGMTPVRETRNAKFGTTLVYFSPFRNEKNPSFEVFPEANKWIDRAEMDRTGDVLNFVARMKNVPDTPANLNEIIKATVEANGGVLLDLPKREYRPREEEKPRIVIDKVSTIWYNSLVDYLNRRCISLDTARLFCKQVHYTKLNHEGVPSKEKVDIGFPNDHNGNSRKADKDGGWELRMESEKKIMPDGSTYQYSSKICNAKEPSYIVDGKNTINIFEGFFDMLSAAEQKKRIGKDPMADDYIVLNSVALADKVIKKLDSMNLDGKRVKLFLDNDNAGNVATEKIMTALQEKGVDVKDWRHIMGSHKDLNEWHIADTKNLMESQKLVLDKGTFKEKKTEIKNDVKVQEQKVQQTKKIETPHVQKKVKMKL